MGGPLKPMQAQALASAPRVGDWITIRRPADHAAALGAGKHAAALDAGEHAAALDAGGHRTATWMVHTGKVEIGQGIHAALRQIAASALDVDIEQVAVAPVSTDGSPNEGTTSGSRSVEDGGALLAAACSTLVAAVQARTGRAEGDVKRAGGVEFALLVIEQDLDQSIDPARIGPTPEGSWIGRDTRRPELDAKVFGAPAYVQDLRMPDLVHARVLRGNWHRGRLLNAASVRELLPAGVRWFQDGDFHALVGDDEDRVVRSWARCRAAARWSQGELRDVDPNDPDWLVTSPAQSSVLLDEPSGGPRGDTLLLSARYARPYLSHGSIGPSCAVASRLGDRLQVWCHSQAIHALRPDIAAALRIDAAQVVVHHREGSGCYGHNGADDAAFDAALLAWRLSAAVRVQWMREDELCCAPFGPATVVDVSATIDGRGRIGDWRMDCHGAGHHSRPGDASAPRLLGAWQMAGGFRESMPNNLPLAAGGGAERNALPLYRFDGARVAVHRMLAPPVRSSSLRSLGALANVFAIESFIDELAAAKGLDPIQLRLDHLDDVRAADVLRDAAARSPWARWRHDAPAHHGIGCAVARYKGTGAWCAVVACVTVESAIRVLDLFVSADLGTVVTPQGARSQIEGGAVQATSWTLKEQVGFDADGVCSSDWDRYPILRFSEVPRVQVNLMDRSGEPALGAGEMAQGPTAAAIANALAHALGSRVRSLPLTFERVAHEISG